MTPHVCHVNEWLIRMLNCQDVSPPQSMDDFSVDEDVRLVPRFVDYFLLSVTYSTVWFG